MNIKSYLFFSTALLLVACGTTDGQGANTVHSTPTNHHTAGNTVGIKALSPTNGVDFIQQKVSTQSNGKISLSAADFDGSSSGVSGYDAGMNAVKNGDISNPAWSAVKGYSGENYSVYLRDPSVAGFSYQTFGQIINDQQFTSEGYVSIGNVYVPNVGEKIDATYHGIAMGTYNNSSEVIADITAKVNLNGSSGTMDIATTNSKIAQNNAIIGYTSINDDSSFDFNDTLTWKPDAHRFESNNTKAQLYGANAAEVGGTFNRTVNDKVFTGGFGAVKQ